MPRLSSFLAATLWLALVGGCKPAPVTSFPQCTLDATLAPTQGAPGDAIQAAGGRYTEVYDTVVTVGGTESTVTDVLRTGCNLCDMCRQAAMDLNECDACQTCFECSNYCDSCQQVVTFTVPEASTGATSVVIQDSYGSTDAIPFTVVAGDTGGSDTGDTGAVDTGTDTGDTGDTGARRAHR